MGGIRTDGVTPGTARQHEQTTEQYTVGERDTMARIAFALARRVGMPTGTEEERTASTRAMIDEICRLNPKFDARLWGDGVTAYHSRDPAAASAHDPDALIPGETLVIPTSAPRPRASETPQANADQDVIDDALPTERTQNNNDPLAPENVRSANRETQGTDGPEEAGEETSGFEKIFGPIRKLFKNPMFQGLMTLLNLIPGLNVVASAVGAIVGLTNIISKMVKGEWKEIIENPLELMSTMFYMAGVFAPGLGAIGGLMGMLQGVKELGTGEAHEQPSQQRRRDETNREAQRNAATEGVPASEQVPRLSNDQLAALLTEVEAGLDNDVMQSEEGFAEWLTQLGVLRRQYDAHMRHAEQTSADEALEQTPALQDVARFLLNELPARVAAESGSLAFGLDELVVSNEPGPGRLCRLPRDMTLDELARTVPGFDGRHQELARAIASYNGLTEMDPNETIPATAVVYVPPSLPAQDRTEWPRFQPLAREDGTGLRQRLASVHEMLVDIESADAKLARSLMLLVLQMPPRPEPMPVSDPAQLQPDA